MDKYLIVLMVVIFCIFLIIYTQRSQQNSAEPKQFKQRVLKAFPEFSVVEKYNNIIISKLNQQHQLQELVTIRIDANQQKNIRLYGGMMIATYPKPPSIREMKKDFTLHLQAIH
ncbi:MULTISPECIES: hypothetical protein [unclassified Acinetobacter]|uniref:hypothetical protein n=1 Tax=unclassified Acinetobacter TaxID=196816 RepID=UPI0029343BCB|nr:MULTISPECIES: hypothetical protein [unclassified Acinetobacter]WOE32075.1 hypothetical protein QSG84_02310 [Acinetobacter sp. SAAs470]WOE37544.1 hypothetical protein QSG86_11355 [Acinetobacter sp. SAAs474]